MARIGLPFRIRHHRPHSRGRFALLLLACLLPLGDTAGAGQRPLASQAGSGRIATLRVEDRGSRWLVWADNRLAGPAEVLVDFSESRNVSSRPLLPARATLPAGGSRVVSVIEGNGSGEPRFRLQVRSIPGQPGTRPEDVMYRLPLDSGAIRVDQGFGGGFSHQDDENRYAIDLAAAPGTPVLAARDGVVMQIERSHGKVAGGTGASGNYVRLLHHDGTMSVYAHLQPGGVLVAPGQQVHAGERIGLSGSTGYTTGPHLHFAVQANRGMQLVSLPFRMEGLPEPIDLPARDGVKTRSGP